MAAKKRKPLVVAQGADLSEVLKSVIDDSGLTRYAVAKAAGIPESALSRAFSGSRSTTWDLLQAVCNGLGLSLTAQVERPADKPAD